jgi:hypothetical protein
VLCVNMCIMFSIAAGATVNKLIIASFFICGLEHFQVISESWSIVVNRTDVSWFEMEMHLMLLIQHHLISFPI